MRYLTYDEILFINATLLGNNSALRDKGLLDSAVNRPQQSAFGEDAYPTITLKAAALVHLLVQNHAFVDGNKRTATLALVIFLRYNGKMEKWTQKALLEFVIEIAQGKHNVDAISTWLEANIE